MGSSADCCPKSIDASAGGLVWVRRRNGSWWPGRIIGQEELAESTTASPKVGTPVKLLGRDNASVDWYNLEKSRRVKAFRCGEYDKCIEKAKAAAAAAAASNTSKKAARYARREDAILHALEIESSSLGKGQADAVPTINKEDGSDHLTEEPPNSSQPHEESENIGKDGNGSEDHSSSDRESSESDTEEAETISTSKEESAQVSQRPSSNDSEEDGTEGAKRMRGLNDLGTGVVQLLKRKRSQVANGCESSKKKNRRRRLMKVLESTAMVSVPVISEDLQTPNESDLAGASGSKEMEIGGASNDTGVLCENGTSINEPELPCGSSIDNCKDVIPSTLGLPKNGVSESLSDVPFVREEKNSTDVSPIVSLVSQKAQIGAGEITNPSDQVGTVALGIDKPNESGPTGTSEIADAGQGIEKETSKWQSKRKRNSRHTRKKPKKKTSGTNYESGTSTAGWSRKTPRTKVPTAELSNPQRLLPFRQSRFAVNPKYESSDFSLRHHKAEILYDVTVEVKSSYRPQHVPYISLVSKLNGRPITGHPLTVEVVNDGFGAQLLMSNRDNTAEDKPAPRGTKQRTKPLRSSKSKKSSLLSKKMRKLSSLTGSQKQAQEKKKRLGQKPVLPVVTCVPLKVVFSRINEALNSSGRTSKD